MIEFIKNISPVEWVVLLAILFILFGRKFLMSLGKSSGETVREVKNIKKSFTDAVEVEEKPADKEVS